MRKSANTNRTYYNRDASGNLVHEFRDYSGYLGEDSHLYYYYDANGNIVSISYNGVKTVIASIPALTPVSSAGLTAYAYAVSS